MTTLNGLRARWHIRRLRGQKHAMSGKERDVVWQRLVALGHSAVNPLIAAFERDSESSWIMVLARIDDESATMFVKNQLSDSRHHRRLIAIGAIANGDGWPRYANAVWSRLDDPNHDVRRAAGRALLKWKWGSTDEQRARIAEAAEDVKAATDLPTPLVVDFYRRVLRDDAFSSEERDVVITSLLEKDRKAGAILLTEEVNRLAASPSNTSGVALIHAIGELKPPAALESLGRLLRPEAHVDLRNAAARALIKLGSPSAAAFAAPYLRTTSCPVATLVILRFGGVEHMDDVLRVLTAQNEYGHQDPHLAATYLQRFGDERAVALQTRFLRSSDHDTAQAAADHLARFGNVDVAMSVIADAMLKNGKEEKFRLVFRGIWNRRRTEMEAALRAAPAKAWADAIVILPADSGVAGLRPAEELLQLAENLERYGNTDIAEAIIRSGSAVDEGRVIAALTRAAGPDNYYKALEGFGRMGLAGTVAELTKCLDSPSVVCEAYLALKRILGAAASHVSDQHLKSLRTRLGERVRTVSMEWDGDALQPVVEGSIDVADLRQLVDEEIRHRGEHLSP
jgi:HEAT repeat protein